MPDRLDPASPRSGAEEGLWVQSWALPGSRGYGVRVNVGPRAWTLSRDRALAYAAALAQRATEGEHDAAVLRLFTERLGLPLETAAQVLDRDLRTGRPVDHAATEPLRLTAGVALDPDQPGGVRPFIAMHLDGERAGQLTPADARAHAAAVLDVLAAADLDMALRRALVGPLGIDEARASAVIASLPEYWPAQEAPRGCAGADGMSWRNMAEVVPHGEPPHLDPGEMWLVDPDRVVAAGGHGSYQVRRPGMCALCPRPGRLLRLECVLGEHRWTQALCAKHEAFCHPGGEVSCLQHHEHVDVVVLGLGPAPLPPGPGAAEQAARRFLARHLRVLASAVNVADWPAYVRSVAAAHDAGTAWLDDLALAELEADLRGDR